MIPRTIDSGSDRVDTTALTVVGFATAAPRDRDRPLNATPGVILSCRHADLPIPLENMTKTSVRVSVLGIGRGGTTMQRDRRLLELGCGDADEQVTDLGGSSAVHPLPVRRLSFRPTVHSLLSAYMRRGWRS
jgi:hypothetical protein